MEPNTGRVDPAVPLLEFEGGAFESYSNLIDADWSLTDVTIRFMQITFAPREDGPTSDNREIAHLEKANITIPWIQAKLLAGLLTKLVASYEATNGELKQPKLAPRPD